MPNTPGSHVGKKHYRLLALQYIAYADLPNELKQRRPKYHGGWYLCRCDCGTEKYIAAVNLLRIKSCGCLNNEMRRYNGCLHQYLIKDRNKFLAGRVTNYYRYNARFRGLSWQLSTEQVLELILQPCFYCGVENSNNFKTPNRRGSAEEQQYNGIDRIDSSKGYSIDNVVPCCKQCNLAKKDMSFEKFRSWIEKVYIHINSACSESQEIA